MALSAIARVLLSNALPGNIGGAKEIADAIDNTTNGNISNPVTVTNGTATALTVGANGATNPVLKVDASTASVATGVSIKGAAAGSGLAIAIITSGTNESATLDAAGTGAIKLNSMGGTGPVQIGGAASGVNATGLTVTPNSAGSGLAIAVVSTGSAENLTINAKGTGTLQLQSVATGAVVFGQGEAGTPAVQTVRAPAAAGTNIAGANLTISGSQSTGTGLGGSIVFQVANLGASGTTANTMGTVLTLAPPNSGTSAVVNGLTVTGSITTAAVALAATGTDTNIPLTINAKGSGALTIGGTSTGQVSLGRGSLNTLIESGTKVSLGAGNVTPTAAQLLGGYITGAQNANTVTLPIAANIDAAIAGVITGDNFTCYYANTGAGVGTITTATGLTLIGTAAVPAGKNAILFFSRTAATPTYDVVIVVSA